MILLLLIMYNYTNTMTDLWQICIVFCIVFLFMKFYLKQGQRNSYFPGVVKITIPEP